MIAYLEGLLKSKSAEEAVVLAGGVGYAVRLGRNTALQLPPEGAPIRLHVHTHVREDDIQLFGFIEEIERTLFRLLISVNGIGPAMAMDVLGGLMVRDLVRAILSEDVETLKSLKGVGPSKARRLLEIKPKLEKAGLAVWAAKRPASDRAEARVGAPSTTVKRAPADPHEEALAALEALGYPRSHGYTILSEILEEAESPPEEITTEALVKKALQWIGRESATRGSIR